jgi:hypothetical protein
MAVRNFAFLIHVINLGFGLCLKVPNFPYVFLNESNLAVKVLPTSKSMVIKISALDKVFYSHLSTPPELENWNPIDKICTPKCMATGHAQNKLLVLTGNVTEQAMTLAENAGSGGNEVGSAKIFYNPGLHSFKHALFDDQNFCCQSKQRPTLKNGPHTSLFLNIKEFPRITPLRTVVAILSLYLGKDVKYDFLLFF